MTETKNAPMPTDDEISVYAYYLWESEGRQPGRDLDYWLQAKAHLIADRQYEANLLEKSKQTPPPVKVKASELPQSTAVKPTRKRSTKSRREPVFA